MLLKSPLPLVIPVTTLELLGISLTLKYSLTNFDTLFSPFSNNVFYHAKVKFNV